MRSTKAFSPSIRHFRTIPRPASFPHNQSMERPTIEALETAREIDDLNLTIKNQRLQLDFAAQQLRTLRVRLNRYEAIIGMEAAA
jgi:hypothetical protein